MGKDGRSACKAWQDYEREKEKIYKKRLEVRLQEDDVGAMRINIINKVYRHNGTKKCIGNM